MRTLYYIIALCCILFVACKQDPAFPREKTLTYELMPLQGVTHPFGLTVRHPFLMLLNLNRIDSLFHVYNLNTHELTHVFGVIGGGPDEFIFPTILSSTSLSNFLISDYSSRGEEISIFEINPNGLAVLKGTKHPNPNNVHGAMGAIFINDSLYILQDWVLFTPYIHMFTLQDEQPRKSWQFRFSDVMEPWFDIDDGSVFANDSRIVFAYQLKKQIDFMDIDFNLIRRVSFNHRHPRSVSRENQHEVKRTYTAGFLGNRFFYALFKGASWNEWLNNPYFRGSILEVFDLDGNPIIRYRLDGIVPSRFVVDEETFTLYGFRDDNEPEDHLIVYRLLGLQ